MAEKKFSGVNGTVDSAEVAEDFAAAQQFDKVKVGKLGVYFKEGFRTKYLSYQDFDRVFIRINEVDGKLCCGKSTFQYFRLVFVRDGKEFTDVISENEKAMDDALARIKALCPEMATGFVK